jgi:hypothetical protein
MIRMNFACKLTSVVDCRDRSISRIDGVVCDLSGDHRDLAAVQRFHYNISEIS